MSTYSDSEIIEQIKKDKRDVLIYLFEHNEAAIVKEMTLKGASEEDCSALLEDALVILWTQVKTGRFVLNEGVTFQLKQMVNDLWRIKTAEVVKSSADKYVSEQEKLKKFIATSTSTKYVSYNRGKVGISVPVFVLVSIAVLWFVIEYKPVEIRTIRKFIRIPSYITSDSPETPDDTLGEGEVPVPVSSRSQPTVMKSDSALKAPTDSSSSVTSKTVGSDPLSFAANFTDSVEDEEIVVRKDILMSIRSLKVIDKSAQDNLAEAGEKSLSKDLVEKLNPEAKLPESESRIAKTYQLEFWKSPVNFKGYKMSKAKIVLFGIDDPESVKIYSVDNILYISNSQNIYKIESTDEFLSLNKIRDNTILSLLR